ncbi:winged helix-turn-helix transcriptional regulator [Microlunatus elymi]|uniref:Winged helix-turn-helix transcriptional regulator n=1 Tax=Microlunatus elymi TaxID=2596828 RepID=A0A516PWB2_9ACTN|nr:MarR family winged helix-turn-helix transcriptional regulator [Microlunatus elymi]QDP95450.1 winged helix-turn-helix transcriptional regulator [Microlunatus elymi]
MTPTRRVSATDPDDRDTLIGTVLEAVVSISRELATARSTGTGPRSPFGDVHLTSSQLDAMFLIAHSQLPLTPGALSARLGVTPGAVSQLIDGLRAQGLIEQVVHPDDARSRLLRLTPAARSAVHRYEADLIARLRPRFAPLTDRQLDTLAGLIRRLEGNT